MSATHSAYDKSDNLRYCTICGCFHNTDTTGACPPPITKKDNMSAIVEAALRWRTYYSGIYDDHSGSCTCRACNLIRVCDEYLEEK